MQGRKRSGQGLMLSLLPLVLAVVLALDASSSLGEYVDQSFAPPPEKKYVINSKSKIQELFKCSGLRPIGFFNEFYVSCVLQIPNQDAVTLLEIQDTTIDGPKLAPMSGIHVELSFTLNSTWATTAIHNSKIQASAVEFSAANITMDVTSCIDVSAKGLKFGPGYNSWFSMGGSYGGIGGASLTDRRDSCDDIKPNDFFRAIGDVSGDLDNFRGYGSGGGNDEARGGGRIQLQATTNAEINGSLLANGGSACIDCYDSAGAGGTIIISAGQSIQGSGIVQANGGNPAFYNKKDDIGGGGGGGGGRIVFKATKMEELDPAHVEAFGGGSISKATNALIEWCQLGGDGTILKMQHTLDYDDDGDGEKYEHLRTDQGVIGLLLVKGGRMDHLSPAKRIQIYGCTPIFDRTTRGAPFLPDNVAQIFASGGATICASIIKLQPNVSTVESAIVLDSGSELYTLDNDIYLSASRFTIQGYIGPASDPDHDLSSLRLEGVDVSLSNALTVVNKLEVNLHGAFLVDKYSVIKFRSHIDVDAAASISIEGFIEPITKSTFEENVGSKEDVPRVRVSSTKDIRFYPQTAQIGELDLVIKAAGSVLVNMPFDTPFLSLSTSGKNVTIPQLNSGPVRQCKPIKYQAEEDTCSTLSEETPSKSPYLINIFASEVASLGNITAGSVLICSADQVLIQGSISSNGLGCEPGVGPGKSSINNGASGGAGHGGRGGNVQPGNIGGGVVYDTSSSFDYTWLHQLSIMTPDTLSASDSGWPIWPGSGAASGDTSDTLIGGNGGGIMYIATKHLHFLQNGMLTAQGGVGTKRGGGGSGGTMTFYITELSGNGTINLSGGESKNPGKPNMNQNTNKSLVWEPELLISGILQDVKKIGGGGGGGVIRIHYLSNDGTSGDAKKFVADGGKLILHGGTSDGGENGGSGVSAGTNCASGSGGVFCLECPPGSHSPDKYSQCVPCDPGTCASHAGAAMCDKCAAGQFNPDFGKTACLACPTGSFTSKTGSRSCTLCPPGKFASSTGSSLCSLCPVGSITTTSGNSNCTLCGIGETTRNAGATVCHACENKPEHAEFNVRGSCSYACEKGRNGLDCLTPFERLVKPIGGPLGFVIIVFSVTGFIFGTWGYISYRSSQYKMQRYADYKAQTLRDELSLTSLTRNLTPRLTDQDLDSHLARLYMSGDNHLNSSWQLNPTFLPATMRDIVYEGTYATFAEKCNDILRWDVTGWEAWVQRILLCLFPPASTLFMRQCQLRRVENLTKYINKFGGGFFREMNIRVHGALLKIGFSPDFSLGYLDVLLSPNSSTPSLLHPSQDADRDLVLVVAGSGSFFRPYHIDTNDILVRAIPSRLALLHHSFWIEFVAEVNQKLRLIPQPSSITRIIDAAKIVRELLSFIAAFNNRHHSDGFVVKFGTFSASASPNRRGEVSSENCCFAAWDGELVEETLQGYTDCPFKLALQVTKIISDDSDRSSSVSVEEALQSDPHSILKSSPKGGLKVDNDPRPAEFRYSQIRMEALFSESDPNSTERNPLNSFPLSPTSKRAPASSSTRIATFLCSEQCKRWLLGLLNPVSPFFRLRNVHPSGFEQSWILPVAMLMLLILDGAVVFWILIEYYCIQVADPTAADSGCSRVAFSLVTCVLPVAIIGAPVLGLVFLTRKSIFYGKLFTYWNIGSIVNLLVAFTCGLVYFAHIHEGILLVILAGLVLKFAEKEVALQCIGQYAGERPLRGWRGLYTTKDWYDSAYTPLVHHEN